MAKAINRFCVMGRAKHAPPLPPHAPPPLPHAPPPLPPHALALVRTLAFALALSLSLSLALAFAAPASMASAAEGGIPNAVLRADQSVVRVVVPLGDIYDDGDYYYQEGSAFVIGQSGGSTYLITNQHVVSLIGQSGEPAARFDKAYVLREDAEGAILDATVIYPPGSGVDLAFLRVDTGLASRPALKVAKSGTVQRGDACYAAGFPGAADQIRDDGRNLPSSPEDVTFSAGVISQVGGEFMGQKTLQITAYINNGNSGGPLLNRKGEVIGINTYGYDSINKSIYSDYIIEAADRMDVPYTLAGGGFGGGSLALAVVGVGAGVLAVAALIAMLAVLARQRKANARRLAAAGAAGAAGARGAQGAADAGGAGGAAGYEGAGGAEGAEGARLRGLRGTGGQYNATAFEVSDRTLIGRDPARCSIVFAPQTQGVSSLHCEILRIGDSLNIIDHNSTYGTFLSGARLQPNVPVELKAGSGFYLGEPRNSFVVY